LTLYNRGYGIGEIGSLRGYSYTGMRKLLLRNGARFRNKQEAYKVMLSRRPEWKRQFLRYTVSDESRKLSISKIKLLFFVFTEGCIYKSKIQFTNNEGVLHRDFSKLMKEVYNADTKTRGKVTYVFSTEIADDLRAYSLKRKIPENVLDKLLESPQLTRDILRIFADTEGSVTISVRRAPRNYTVVDRRVVISCTNPIVRSQLIVLLNSLGIEAGDRKDTIQIMEESSLREFALQVSFSPGVRVVRKKAGHGVWYMHEKSTLLRLLIRVYDEQKAKGRRGRHEGVFRTCTKKEDVMCILNSWYDELKGG